MSGLRTLGRRAPVLGADAFTPQQVAGSLEMSPAQLADLDRKLSPAEQKRVDNFQIGVADAIQKKEEATVYVDPKTGERRVAIVTYESSDAAPPAPSKESNTVWYVAGGAAVVAIVVALLVRSR